MRTTSPPLYVVQNFRIHNLVDGRRRKQHRGNPMMRYSTRNEHPTLLSIRWLWRQYKIWIFPSFVVKICKNTFFGVSNLRCVPYKIYGGGLRSRSCISCMWRLQSRSHLGRDLYGPAERRCTDRTVTATDLSIFFPCGVDFILNGLLTYRCVSPMGRLIPRVPRSCNSYVRLQNRLNDFDVGRTPKLWLPSSI